MVKFIDRSPMGQVDALCERITKTLTPSSWYPGEFKDEEYHTPFVHAQYLPVSKTEDKERDKTKDYPLVQVVCTTGEITDFSEVPNGSAMNIQIFFGGYCKDTNNQGWRIAVAMLWRVLQELLSDTLLNGYQLTTPIKWTIYPSKEPPYYTAMMETVWHGCPPSIEIPIENKGLFGDDSEI